MTRTTDAGLQAPTPNAWLRPGEAPVLALFAMSGLLGLLLGDQPGVTLFCWAVVTAGMALVALRHMGGRGAQQRPAPARLGGPRSWGLRLRP